ncbi:ribonuclease HII [Candidatus Woesearchaeota archaeon]|nr:ribonuclease HII [Candidatus Woesearchaeota archaeon]
MGFVAGIDEAGRGPVLGPMVMAVVAGEQKDVDFLNQIGVKDSKLLTPIKRNKLARIIKQRLPHAIIKVSPKDIDKSISNPHSSLNDLEAFTSGKLIKRLIQKVSVQKIILDLPSKNKEDYVAKVRSQLSFPASAIPILAEYKADLNHAQVAAASILAKVTRDKAIEKMAKKLNLRLGSGYPADANTIHCLYENFNKLKEYEFVRLEWKTTKELLNKKRQTTLKTFT